MEGDHVLAATGGLSYKLTGSTGDGFDFAEKPDKVTELSPSLVLLRQSYIPRLVDFAKTLNLRLSGKKVLFRILAR